MIRRHAAVYERSVYVRIGKLIYERLAWRSWDSLNGVLVMKLYSRHLNKSSFSVMKHLQ